MHTLYEKLTSVLIFILNKIKKMWSKKYSEFFIQIYSLQLQFLV